MNTNQAKAKPTIMIRLYGPGIVPETVGVGTMAELVQAIQSLSGTKLHLMNVRRRSAGYLVAADDDSLAISGLTTSGKALEQPESYLASSMLNSFDTITTILKKLDCELEISSVAKTMRWTVNKHVWPNIREKSIISDEATITGTLQRVGGATERKCGISIPGLKRMMICKVSSDRLARHLGRQLYKVLSFRGKGSYFTRDWSLINFRVDDFSVVNRVSFDEVYRSIRAASGNAWDDVKDVNKELEDMR